MQKPRWNVIYHNQVIIKDLSCTLEVDFFLVNVVFYLKLERTGTPWSAIFWCLPDYCGQLNEWWSVGVLLN